MSFTFLKGTVMTQMPKTDSKIDFEHAIKALEVQAANLGAHLTIDSAARQTYVREIAAMADGLRRDAAAGKITWLQAAQQAQETRNLVMETTRMRSTPVARALARRIKSEGYALNELVARQVARVHGERVVFARLADFEKNKIDASIVTSAGKSNANISAAMRRVSFAGRSVLILSLGVSVYIIATSTNKVEAVRREAITTGASIGGGIAGGALAGLACGPGAPVCVTVGAFVGGVLAAYGAGFCQEAKR